MKAAAKLLGRLPAKSDPRALMFSRYAAAPRILPDATNFWTKRPPFPLRTFGNTEYQDCTRAKQANAAMRMEYLETGKVAEITDDEVIRVYRKMEDELYGGGDKGAYETDALDQWRRQPKTFRDTSRDRLTIDAYTRVNHLDQDELRSALYVAGAHGIAVCLNLPLAFQGVEPPKVWDIPKNQTPVGKWLPGSWGGHSMWARDYDKRGIWLVHTWGLPDQLVTWRAAAVYLDEAHLVIDSIDYWREKKPQAMKYLDFNGIRRAVNRVSRQKVD